MGIELEYFFPYHATEIDYNKLLKSSKNRLKGIEMKNTMKINRNGVSKRGSYKLRFPMVTFRGVSINIVGFESE